MTKKPWGGRFQEPTDKMVERFTASLHYDRRLYKYDISGSIAHAKMLAKQKIIKQAEAQKIAKALKEVEKEIDAGSFAFDSRFEDIHMAIEARLIAKIGTLGGKLHTGRSRNDQVSLDMRMYLRDEIKDISKLLLNLERALIQVAKKYQDVIMPGYTHLQRAQAIPLAHHLLAYFQMFKRDIDRFMDCYVRTNVMPLGSGALASTSLPIDRNYVAKQLGFAELSRNSLDAVSDRDFVVEFLSTSAITMMHLSRLSEELIIWSSSEFDFIRMPDSFCTGSSLMPHKKNPDVSELTRGKTGRIYGNLFNVLTIMKSLPLSYNRDLQEDKEPLFDTIDQLKETISVNASMIKGIKVNKKAIEIAASDSLILATDVAEYLVIKGVPFRLAHEIVGRMVNHCVKNNKDLNKIPLHELQKYSKAFDKDYYSHITLEKTVNRRNAIGGPAASQVAKELKAAEKFIRG